MGLRTRLKGIARRAIRGGSPASPSASPPAQRPVAPQPVQPQQAAPPEQATAETAPAPAPPAPAPAPAPPAASASSPAPAEGTRKVDPEKIRRHYERARKGVLKHLSEQPEETLSLRELHDYSERRYFIAHKKFSDLMEDLVELEWIRWHESRGEAELSEEGRAWLSEQG